MGPGGGGHDNLTVVGVLRSVQAIKACFEWVPGEKGGADCVQGGVQDSGKGHMASGGRLLLLM